MALVLLCALSAAGARAQTSLSVNRLQIISAAGSASENCQGLRDALAAIIDAGSTNPYTLRLEPGRYDCGTESVVMKPHVDLEGSGEGVTRILGNRDSTAVGVVRMADQSELRFVTVENTGSSEPSPTTDHIAVSADDGESRIVRARLVSGPGDFGSCGLFVDDGATVHVDASTIIGDLEGLTIASGGTAVVAYSQLVNSYNNSGTLTCVFSHDEMLDPLDAFCDPPL